MNPKACERRERIRHQTFAACLVDRGNNTIGHSHTKAPLPRGDCGGETRRATTDDKNVCLSQVAYQCSNTSSEQKPGPIAASTLHSPALGRRSIMNFSSTARTEAEERLPVLRRLSHEALSAP